MDLQSFFDKLDGLYRKKDLMGVEQYLKIALREAADDGSAQIAVLNEMMGFYRNTGRTARSLEYTGLALEKMRGLGLAKGAEWGTALLNAATAYRAAGDADRALELYQQAEEAYLQDGGQDQRLSAVYNNTSALYMQRGDYNAARELLLRALEISAGKNSDVEEAIMRGNLAIIYDALCCHKDAERELELSLHLYEKDAAEGREWDPHSAAVLAARAKMLYRQGDFCESADLLEHAAGIIKSHFGENNDYYLLCNNCAEALLAAGDGEKAGKYARIAAKASGESAVL